MDTPSLFVKCFYNLKVLFCYQGALFIIGSMLGDNKWFLWFLKIILILAQYYIGNITKYYMCCYMLIAVDLPLRFQLFYLLISQIFIYLFIKHNVPLMRPSGNKLLPGSTLYYTTWTNYSTSLSLFSFLLFQMMSITTTTSPLCNCWGDEDYLFVLVLHTKCYMTIKTLLRQGMFRSALNASLKVLGNIWIITRKNFWFELACPPCYLAHLILAKRLWTRVRTPRRNSLLEFLPKDLPAMRGMQTLKSP